MRQLILPAAFGVSALGLYVMLSVPVLASAPSPPAIWWLASALLYEVVAASVATEVAELAWGMVLPPVCHQRASTVTSGPVRVAVLYLCCDDVDETALASLRAFHEVDVFVLDDSTQPGCRARVDNTGFRVVRRASRAGYKAGNLNHWLARWGTSYDYFAILDSDSVMSPQAVWELVGYLEHPSNRDVAIVQATVLSRPGNPFQDTTGTWAAMRARVLSRVHERLGWSLSQGHNAVHRTRAVLDEGGFDLAASCEDTLISLHLLRSGWRILTVDVVSHGGEPSNALRYRRRHLRWAGQTVEVIVAFRGGLPPRLTLLMAKHLLSYLRPACCIALLGLTAYRAPHIEVQDAWRLMVANLGLAPGYVWSGIALYGMLGTFVALVLLQYMHGLCNGVGGRRFLVSLILGGAMMSFCGPWVPVTMLGSVVGRRVHFTPTQSVTRGRYPPGSLFGTMAIPWLVHLAIAVRVCCNPGLLAIGFTSLWVLALAGYPLVLWVFHLRPRRSGSVHPV